MAATAAQRGSRQLISRCTAGSSPIARNSANNINVSTDVAATSRCPRAYAVSTPAPPNSPIMYGDRRLIGGPGRPSAGPSPRSARASASAARATST
jgi:hypothetical protein